MMTSASSRSALQQSSLGTACRRPADRRPAVGARAGSPRTAGSTRRRWPPGTAPAAGNRGVEVPDHRRQVLGECPGPDVEHDRDLGHVHHRPGQPRSTMVVISSGGRLSTTNQPRSSRHFAAVDRPAPENAGHDRDLDAAGALSPRVFRRRHHGLPTESHWRCPRVIPSRTRRTGATGYSPAAVPGPTADQDRLSGLRGRSVHCY